MTTEELMALCESMPGAYYDYPFGPEPRCFRIGGRIFAHVYPTGVPGALGILFPEENIPREVVEPMAGLRCTPEEADFWRRQFPGAVVRPYHSPPAQWPYSNTVLFQRGVPDEVLCDMVAGAYATVLKKLTKKQREELAAMGK